MRRIVVTFLGGAALCAAAGCELTASLYIQQEYRSVEHLAKPDGLAKAEIKVSKLIGRDAPKDKR